MAWRRAVFYNIDQPVGKDKANLVGDVALVQYLLARLVPLLTGQNSVGYSLPDGKVVWPTLPIGVSGHPDQNLFNWIFWYQTQKQTGSFAFDGVIDPVPNNQQIFYNTRYILADINSMWESGLRDEYYVLPFHRNTPQIVKDHILTKIK